MAATYTPIASITLGATATSVTFSSIPQTYTDLILVTNVASTGTADMDIRVNSDTGSNYGWTALSGSGSAAVNARGSNDSKFRADQYGIITTAFNQMNIVQFMNYSNSTTYKTFISRASNASSGTDLTVGTWRSTSAITTITVINTLITGSTLNLYGILGANA